MTEHAQATASNSSTQVSRETPGSDAAGRKTSWNTPIRPGPHNRYYLAQHIAWIYEFPTVEALNHRLAAMTTAGEIPPPEKSSKRPRRWLAWPIKERFGLGTGDPWPDR